MICINFKILTLKSMPVHTCGCKIKRLALLKAKRWSVHRLSFSQGMCGTDSLTVGIHTAFVCPHLEVVINYSHEMNSYVQYIGSWCGPTHIHT